MYGGGRVDFPTIIFANQMVVWQEVSLAWQFADQQFIGLKQAISKIILKGQGGQKAWW